MEEDAEYKNLPLEERCVHKLWKARIDGYEECMKVFAAITDEKSPELRKYESLMKKFATDSNAVSLDKALDAVLTFISNAHVTVKTVGDVTAGLVSKALAAQKKTTQDKAYDIILMCVEVEKYEVVQEELMKGFGHKNPKVGVGCLRAITSALRDFGNKVISIKLLVKSIGPLLENRDKNIREETKKMVIEMYRWVGIALKPQLTSLKPVQLQELEAEFEKIGKEKVVPTRLLKSHQERKVKLEEGDSDSQAEDIDEPDDTIKIDPLDLGEEVHILDQLSKDFYDKIEAKKWQERKEALDSIITLSQNAKLSPGSYGDLIKALKKVISKDSNVLLVALAGNCITNLAKGLRKDFNAYAVSCIDTILNKFKEKKLNVIMSMRVAVDAVYQTTSIEPVLEVTVGSLGSKNPNVKAETASFLARSFCYCTHTMLSKKVLKGYVTELLKTLNESDPTVRDSSAEALGTLLKIVGEKVMDPHFVDTDDLKMKKIKEYCEKADIKVKAPVGKSKTAKEGIKGKKPVARRPLSSKLASKDKEESNVDNEKEEIPEQDEDLDESNDGLEQNKHPAKSRERGAVLRGQGGAAAKGNVAKRATRPISATRGQSASSQKEKDDTGPLLQVNNMKHTRMKDEQKLKTIRWDFSSPRPDFISQLKDQMELANVCCSLVIQMFHKDFKFHIKAIENLQKDLTINSDAGIANLDLILRWLTIRFFDTNPSVILKAMDYLKQLFNLLNDNNYNLLDYEAYSFLPYLVLKFGDPKDSIRLSAQNITSLICHIYPASKASSYILDGMKSKNARQRTVCLETLSSLIESNGMAVCQPTPAVSLKEVARHIADRDNSVRTAALNTLLQVYYREGEKVFKYIGTLPAKDLSLLEERIKRAPKSRAIIKKPQGEPQNQVVRPGDSYVIGNITKEVRGSRVVPTVAQPPPAITFRSTSSISLFAAQGNVEDIIEKPPLLTEENAMAGTYSFDSEDDCSELLQSFDTYSNNSKESILLRHRDRAAMSKASEKAKRASRSLMSLLEIIEFGHHSADSISKQKALENQSSSSSRFQIDYDFLKKLLNDDVENGNETGKCNMQLEEVEDIDSILQDDDTMHHITSRLAKGNFSHSNYVSNDNIDDSSKVINSVIAQVANPDSKAVIAALSQLDELMKSDDKITHLYQHIDQLLIVISLQFRIVLNTKMAESYPNKEECIRLYRSLIHCLLSIFQKDELGTRATRDPLHDVVQVILSIIIDTRLSEIKDGEQVIKSLNVVVVRMIENANFTTIFSALLKLLHESVGYSLNGKLTELAMKCNWKTIRTLSSRSKELDVALILADLHDFLLAYPSHTWSDKSSNKPLKTIKTILHNLVEIYGSDILNYVSKLANYQGSELQKYIVKTISSHTTNKGESAIKDSNKVSPNVEKGANKTSAKRLSKAANEALSEIFKKIGSKENKQEGLQQLYEFKEKYPAVDFESYLKKSSTVFQSYIERGLKKIEMENKNVKISSDTAFEAPISSKMDIDPTNVNVHELVDDFKTIAQQAGFDNTYIQAAINDIYKKESDNPKNDT